MKIEQRQPKSAPDAPMATSPENAAPVEEVEGLLDVGYVAAKLKVCKATVYKMVKEGAIEAVHLNRGLATLYGTLSRGIEIHEKGSSGMADPRRPRKFSEEFKRQIVQLYDNGKPVSEIGAEYDLSHSTVHRWIKSIHGSGSTRAADNRTPEQQRILELEKENKQLRMEVDVLKTAALIFARK